MKKIGFIDYFLDEWHAEKYPEWIYNATGGQMKVTYAYGKVDSPTGASNAEWCKKKEIQLLDSIEEVVEKSDYLIVLSPDYPEYHQELSELPLQSGKPTYIDKTFAPDRKTAIQLFERAHQYGTPMYSTSALRYAAEYTDVDRHGLEMISSSGPGQYANYSIHQIEPIVKLLGPNATRVMWMGTPTFPALLIGYADGRQALVQHFGGSFQMALNYNTGKSTTVKVESDFFNFFIQDLVRFFATGQPIVPAEDTIAIVTIIEYGMKAAQTPYQWIELPTS